MVVFALFIFANFEEEGLTCGSRPSDRAELHGQIGAMIKIGGPGEDLLRLFKANATFGILPQLLALAPIERESH